MFQIVPANLKDKIKVARATLDGAVQVGMIREPIEQFNDQMKTLEAKHGSFSQKNPNAVFRLLISEGALLAKQKNTKEKKEVLKVDEKELLKIWDGLAPKDQKSLSDYYVVLRKFGDVYLDPTPALKQFAKLHQDFKNDTIDPKLKPVWNEATVYVDIWLKRFGKLPETEQEQMQFTLMIQQHKEHQMKKQAERLQQQQALAKQQQPHSQASAQQHAQQALAKKREQQQASKQDNDDAMTD
jgi:hypothetical protein